MPRDLDDLCQQGQHELMETQYLQAEATLVEAERQALASGNFDALSRLYMPLQEARRQRRQRCGEGIVRLDLIARAATDVLYPDEILARHPHGQLLVAGWGTVEPAARVRALAGERALYVESFLAAAYPVDGAIVVIITPYADVALPQPRSQSRDALLPQLPPCCLVLGQKELVSGARRGTFETYGHVMAMWERLHMPFLAEADRQPDLTQKIEGYRQTIRVDYACELAHQKLSHAARELGRQALAARQ
jgi:hypothetical protein